MQKIKWLQKEKLMKLLLVEDDKELSSAIVRILKLNNFNVDTAYDGIEALDILESAPKDNGYDAVILDVMMPRLDGIGVVKKMRERGDNTPTIMLTAKSETDDKVAGLDSGADDYLTKPFSSKELIARIRALTRRKSQMPEPYTFGNMTLNPNTFEIIGPNGTARLTNKEFQMLEVLMLNNNTLISTSKFMDRIWDYDSEAEINVVWVYISSLRKKLSAIGANVSLKAMRGVGYKLRIIDQME